MTLSRGEYGWVEAGTVLHFEPQPNKSYIPRLGQYFPSYEVVKMEAYIALRERVQELECSVELDQAAYAILGRLHQQVLDLTAHLATLTTAHQQAVWPNIIVSPKYENPDPRWEDPKLPDFTLIWKLAREVGYAVGIHGSLKRDVDLIAAPWTDEAVGNKALIDHLCAGLNATMIELERKPCGRYACTLQIDGYYKPIDLSIMPRHADLQAQHQQAVKERDTLKAQLRESHDSIQSAAGVVAALQSDLQQAVEALAGVRMELLKRWTVEYEKALDEQDAIIKRMEAMNDMYGWNLHEGLRFGAIEMDLAIRRVIKAMFTGGGGT